MLHNCTYYIYIYVVYATQLYVLVVVACVVLTHMLDATQLHIHVVCYATVCARTVRIMHGWGAWLTGTQALDKVWSHLKRSVPKSLCSRSKSDRRFNLSCFFLLRLQSCFSIPAVSARCAVVFFSFAFFRINFQRPPAIKAFNPTVAYWGAEAIIAAMRQSDSVL